MPESGRPMVRRGLDHLERCGALRREVVARPEDIPGQLLAVADLFSEAPYGRCAALLAARATVCAPVDWLQPLDAALRQLSVRAEPPTSPGSCGVLVRIGEVEVALAPDDGWLVEPIGQVERSVAAAAVAAEAVARFLGRPARPLPGARRLPGLDRRGPRTSTGAPLLDPWPAPEQLRELLLDPASLLPAGELKCPRPAAVRPLAAGEGPRMPDWLRALLWCVHVPLRWESGDLAHSGGWAHRGLASARGFYPVELYLVTDTGAWYVEPGDLRLVPVSPSASSDPGSRFTLVLTVRETKVSHRYDRYATRLCLQEAGLALAALGDAAREAGIAADAVAELGERGRSGPWGELLDLGPDERPVGRIMLGPPQRALDARSFARHLALVRQRRSGHRVFDALGAERVGRLGSLPAELTAALDDRLSTFLVVHRPCLDAAAGRWEPGCYRVTGHGPEPVRAGLEPTEQLQRGQDAMGWLAPDYLSASATVIVAVPVDEATADVRRLHDITAAAARIAHRGLLGAAAAGAVGRIHNSLRADVVAAVTGEKQLAPLFQLIVGCAGPDGTITVDVAEAAFIGNGITKLTGDTRC
uniref:Dehydrogenase n=1 Tax=Streptomyces sp. ATCC 55365 TaxID=1073998 RepID=G1ECM0_9ACTN|nr:dehydrogenase [Streptomyces sp. ATCC 55365]